MNSHRFEPYQPVLVRISGEWCAAFFSHMDESGCYLTTSHHIFPCDGVLPYNDETKHLLGTVNDFKPPWQPKPGELVAVQGIGSPEWGARKFIRYSEHGKAVCQHEGHPEKEQEWLKCEPLRNHFNVPEE